MFGGTAQKTFTIIQPGPKKAAAWCTQVIECENCRRSLKPVTWQVERHVIKCDWIRKHDHGSTDMDKCSADPLLPLRSSRRRISRNQHVTSSFTMAVTRDSTCGERAINNWRSLAYWRYRKIYAEMSEARSCWTVGECSSLTETYIKTGRTKRWQKPKGSLPCYQNYCEVNHTEWHDLRHQKLLVYSIPAKPHTCRCRWLDTTRCYHEGE